MIRVKLLTFTVVSGKYHGLLSTQFAYKYKPCILKTFEGRRIIIDKKIYFKKDSDIVFIVLKTGCFGTCYERHYRNYYSLSLSLYLGPY